MSITVEQIQNIKEEAEQKRRQIEREKGRLEQFLRNLKEEFDCDTVEEAKQKLQEYREKGEATMAKIDKLSCRVVELWEQVTKKEGE